MKNELQGKLTEILTSIQTTVGKANDFAIGQLPDIAQSYMVYGRVWITAEALTWFLLFSVLLFVCIRYGWNNKEAVHTLGWGMGDWYAHRIYITIFGTLGSIVCGVVALASIKSAALVWLAPKVWLIKEIATLIK